MITEEVEKVEDTSQEEKPVTTSKKLDDDGLVRLENLLLKQQVENLTRELEDSRRKNDAEAIERAKTNYQSYLAKKYDVDTNTHDISVDVRERLVTIQPIE